MLLKTKNYIYPGILLAVSSLFFTACRNSHAPEEQTTKATTITVPDSMLLPVADSLAVYDTAALILNTSDYHADEVPKDAVRRIWLGLFRNAGTYYLDTTRIRTETVFDAVLDEDEHGVHTGINISAQHKDTAVLLISGVPNLKTGKVNTVPGIGVEEQPFFVLQPDDSFRFEYEGTVYTLLARARKTPLDSQPDAYSLSDYRLYLSGIKAGKAIRQLLTAQATLDDAAIGIMFCGDLDGDHVPDFIINTSNHYNVFQPTLYLSAGAGKDRWLRMVAKHTSVGC